MVQSTTRLEKNWLICAKRRFQDSGYKRTPPITLENISKPLLGENLRWLMSSPPRSLLCTVLSLSKPELCWIIFFKKKDNGQKFSLYIHKFISGHNQRLHECWILFSVPFYIYLCWKQQKWTEFAASTRVGGLQSQMEQHIWCAQAIQKYISQHNRNAAIQIKQGLQTPVMSNGASPLAMSRANTWTICKASVFPVRQ